MKKFLVSLLAVAAVATAGVGVTQSVSSAQAATRTAVKSYHFDRNTFTGEESNFNSYRYETIPAWSEQTGYQNQQIDGA